MSELVNHLQQIPTPMAMVIAVGALTAQVDFRAARQERRHRILLEAKETRESSS